MVLKEMGIKKIGDRVRIFVAIKALRSKTGANSKKRSRDSLAPDNRQHTPYTPPSSSSPRHAPGSARNPLYPTNRQRYSLMLDGKIVEPSDRPGSPYTEENYRRTAQRTGESSPNPNPKKEQGPGYFPGTAPSVFKSFAARPNPSAAVPRAAGGTTDSTVGRLRNGLPVIRVIYSGGQTKVLDIRSCNTLEDVVISVLKKLSLSPEMARNYCFWTLDGTGQDLNTTHKLTDAELMRLCSEPFDRNERGRLILRKKHAGEPEEDELRKASSIALEEQNEMHAIAIANNKDRSQVKIQKLTGTRYFPPFNAFTKPFRTPFH